MCTWKLLKSWHLNLWWMKNTITNFKRICEGVQIFEDTEYESSLYYCGYSWISASIIAYFARHWYQRPHLGWTPHLVEQEEDSAKSSHSDDNKFLFKVKSTCGHNWCAEVTSPRKWSDLPRFRTQEGQGREATLWLFFSSRALRSSWKMNKLRILFY